MSSSVINFPHIKQTHNNTMDCVDSAAEPVSRQAARRAARLETKKTAGGHAGGHAAATEAATDSERIARYADELDKSLALDMSKPVGATSSAPFLYVVVDSFGFVGAFLSLAAAVDLALVKYAPLPFVIQRYPTAPGPVGTAYVVALAANDSVLCVSNSQGVAARVNLAYNAIGIAVEDSAEFLSAPVGQVAPAAVRRLDLQLAALSKYAADTSETTREAIAAERPTELEQIIREAGVSPTYPKSHLVTVVDQVPPFHFEVPAAETVPAEETLPAEAMLAGESVDDWLDRVLDAIPPELADEWGSGAAADEAALVAALGDRVQADQASNASEAVGVDV